MLFAPGDTQTERWRICETCDQKVERLVLICKACSCHLPSKISMAGAACPLGKWQQGGIPAGSLPSLESDSNPEQT